MNSHLTSQQMERAFAGRPDHAVTQHLSGCSRCREELASFTNVFASLPQQAASAANLHRRLARVPQRSGSWLSLRVCGVATAVLLLGVAAPLAVRFQTPVGQAPAAPAAPAQVAAVMSDDALLTSVQNDLSSSVPESLLPLSAADSQTVSTQATKGK